MNKNQIKRRVIREKYYYKLETLKEYTTYLQDSMPHEINVLFRIIYNKESNGHSSETVIHSRFGEIDYFQK